MLAPAALALRLDDVDILHRATSAHCCYPGRVARASPAEPECRGRGNSDINANICDRGITIPAIRVPTALEGGWGRILCCASV